MLEKQDLRSCASFSRILEETVRARANPKARKKHFRKDTLKNGFGEDLRDTVNLRRTRFTT